MLKKPREIFREYFIYGALSALGVLLLVWTAALMLKYYDVAG